MSDTKPLPNRWLIAIMGTCLQLCLGTVYAWSYFQKPLCDTYNWTNSQVALAFSLAICFLGLSAAWGGINLPKMGPTKLAVSGGILFGLGYLLGALALHLQSLALLYIGYGVIGGCGLGLGYVTPVATSVKWFPDKKGFVSGMVVMGFGFGALIMSKVLAPWLMEFTGKNLVQVFAYLGGLFLILPTICGSFMQNPPAGYVPEGWTPPAAATTASGQSADDAVAPLGSYLMSGKFLCMWLLFFCNITAGIAIIGFQSPLLQDLYIKSDPQYQVMTDLRKLDKEEKAKQDEAVKAGTPAEEAKKITVMTPDQRKSFTDLTGILAGFGATLIALSSIFNGLGRFFWGGLSDKIGRVQAFRILMGTQILVFLALVFVGNPTIFSILFCYILLCYGGGFGTMPSFVGDVFGAKMMGVVYGFVLTAWSAAGIAGPLLVAWIKDSFPAEATAYSFYMGAGFMAVGFVFTLLTTNDRLIVQAEAPKAA